MMMCSFSFDVILFCINLQKRNFATLSAGQSQLLPVHTSSALCAFLSVPICS